MSSGPLTCGQLVAQFALTFQSFVVVGALSAMSSFWARSADHLSPLRIHPHPMSAAGV
ncbi:hypothetical protein ID866_9187 [Astraeus odoratus]|nr:hypothetical protein ID866_9187 [Astraeus odoratus]